MKPEEKELAKANAAKPPTEPKFSVGQKVKHATAFVTIHANVKSLAWRARPGTKSDTEWFYELDTAALPGNAFVPESTLSK